MMDCTALYFPGTAPGIESIEALLLVHEAVCWYQSVEGLPLGELEPLARRGLVKAIVPAPLGEDRQRFERTVRDLLAHGQEYQGAYLAAMAAAVEPGRPTPGWAIVAGLTGRPAEPDQELWQARLLLQLQEVLDRQEREIGQGLAVLAADKTALLSALRGEAPSAPSARLGRPAALSPARTAQLVRAWTRLFFTDQTAVRPLVLATDLEGGAALLLADCEKFCKKAGQPVLELVLPRLAGLAMADFLGRLESFRRQAAAPLFELRQALLEMALAPGDELPAAAAARLPGLATRWGEELAAHFEPAAGGAGVLAFHRLPGVSLARLLAQPLMGNRPPAVGESPASGLLAVLEMRR